MGYTEGYSTRYFLDFTIEFLTTKTEEDDCQASLLPFQNIPWYQNRIEHWEVHPPLLHRDT